MQPPITPQSRHDLEELIRLQVEESSSLEYKAADAVNRKNQQLSEEMTKDISAFANAAGGTVIYGIAEYTAKDLKHRPERITPVSSVDYPKEWFDQIIGRIQPRIEAIRVQPVHVGPAASDFCFCVIVPQSTTAHQALDLRYYRRRNFERTAMEDYEVRDVMNRQKHPRLTILLGILPALPTLARRMKVVVKNEGLVMARYFRIVVRCPMTLDSRAIFVESGDSSLIHNTDNSFSQCWKVELGNGIGLPLFPLEVREFERQISYPEGAPVKIGQSISDFQITAYADSMEPIELTKEVASVQGGFA